MISITNRSGVVGLQSWPLLLFLPEQNIFLGLPGSLLALIFAWPWSHLLEKGWSGPQLSLHPGLTRRKPLNNEVEYPFLHLLES